MVTSLTNEETRVLFWFFESSIPSPFIRQQSGVYVLFSSDGRFGSVAEFPTNLIDSMQQKGLLHDLIPTRLARALYHKDLVKKELGLIEP